MATITNTALNSRSLNGIILISDGNGTTIENGNIETGDINSDSLTTNNINTSLLTCNGEFRCNLNGPLTIPISISSLTGLLISYGNTSNSGATDFTNFGSTYTITQQGFRFFNKSNTQTLTNLAIIDNSQTYFSSQLTGVTCESPVGGTSVVNKNFTDTTYINFTTDQTITGTKRFNTIFTGDHSWRDVGSPFSNRVQSYVTGTTLEFVPQFASNIYRFNTKDGAAIQTTPLIINSASTSISNSLITNNLTADNIIGTQNIYTTNTSGIINIGTGLTTGTLNIGTLTSNIINNSINTLNSQHTFNNSTPICSVATPTANNHLVRKDYVDTNFMFKTGTITESINGIKTFTNRVNFNGSSPCIVATGTSEFTGANGYFAINPNMGAGTLNAASETGTIGIVGLKDQTTDKVLFTLYGTTHVSVKLSFAGVSIGFGGSSQIANTSVTCDGTNVIIKPNIKFSGDNTIQNSAFTGAGSLNGTYNLSNITIDANGKITSLSSGLTTTNSFSGVNTFTNNVNCASSITFTDIGNFSTIQQNSAILNIENPSLGSTIRLKTRPSVGAVQNSLTLNTTSCDILSPTLNLTGASPTSILSPNNLNGTINLFNNLTSGGTLNIGSNAGVNIINGQTTINNKLIVGVNGNTGLNLEVLQQLYLYSVNGPYTDYARILNVGGGTMRYHSYSPIQGYSSKHDFYSSLNGLDDATNRIVSFETGAALTKVYNTFEVAGSSTFSDIITCDNGAIFNNVIPTSNISATSGDELVNYTTLNAQGFVTSSSILSANNNFTGFNTFSSGLTVRSTLLLKDTANVLQSSIDLLSGGLLTISCSVNSGKVILSTHDSVGNSYNRFFVNENEVNITAPLTLDVDYSYYNPGVFTSTRLGYSKSNTGSSNTLTNNNVNNSGRINIDAGSWNISYTATLTVISATLTTLKSLEVYIGDVSLNDLNIIGLNVLNYYNTSSVAIGQKIKISGSGNYISYTNVATELNLLILPLFTAGLAGLTFQGKISATRNA